MLGGIIFVHGGVLERGGPLMTCAGCLDVAPASGTLAIRRRPLMRSADLSVPTHVMLVRRWIRQEGGKFHQLCKKMPTSFLISCGAAICAL